MSLASSFSLSAFALGYLLGRPTGLPVEGRGFLPIVALSFFCVDCWSGVLQAVQWFGILCMTQQKGFTHGTSLSS
jgi:hypothetical protein